MNKNVFILFVLWFLIVVFGAIATILIHFDISFKGIILVLVTVSGFMCLSAAMSLGKKKDCFYVENTKAKK
jgi:NADH:ubiquinone oxidoreductase subunit 6 (subunit J)